MTPEDVQAAARATLARAREQGGALREAIVRGHGCCLINDPEFDEQLWRDALAMQESHASLASRLAAETARAEELAEALRGSAWKDADGPCWCMESVEITGLPHIARCLAARAALARYDAAKETR